MKSLFAGGLTLLGFAVMVVQPARAFEGSTWGQQGHETGQVKQRGKDNREVKPWEVRPWDATQSEARPSLGTPSETRPWEAASEEVRPKESRPGDEGKATEHRRRAGRKARKERNEKNHEQSERLSSYQDRTKQRQERWRRLQMQSELYNSQTVR
jgi:hypothetical protein